MEWRRFLKLYFLMIFFAAALAAAVYAVFAYRDKLADMHMDPEVMAAHTVKAVRRTAAVIGREVPLWPGKISRAFKKTMRFIRTSGDDPARDLKAVGLIDEKKP